MDKDQFHFICENDNCIFVGNDECVTQSELNDAGGWLACNFCGNRMSPMMTTEQMHRICLLITIGEYEHDENHYFYGTKNQARMYAISYLNDIWGADETMYDHLENAYYSNDFTRCAKLWAIYPYDKLSAMTPKGAMQFAMSFKLE